jgi:hypothetical protein
VVVVVVDVSGALVEVVLEEVVGAGVVDVTGIDVVDVEAVDWDVRGALLEQPVSSATTAITTTIRPIG